VLRLEGDCLLSSLSVSTRPKSLRADLGETIWVEGAEEEPGERPKVFSNSKSRSDPFENASKSSSGAGDDWVWAMGCCWVCRKSKESPLEGKGNGKVACKDIGRGEVGRRRIGSKGRARWRKRVGLSLSVVEVYICVLFVVAS